MARSLRVIFVFVTLLIFYAERNLQFRSNIFLLRHPPFVFLILELSGI